MIKFKEFLKKDIPHRVRWLNNPRLNKFIGEIGVPASLSNEEKWFEIDKKSKNKKIFIIYDNLRPIGFVGLSKINKVDKNAELLVAIGEDDYCGRGLGKLSTKWIVDYGFRKLNLQKIKLSVTSDNLIAIKMYKSLGFVIEGELKNEIISNKEFRDLLLMAIFNN